MKKFLLAAVLSCALASSVYAAPTYDQASEAARAAYNSGQLPEAKEQAQQALALATTPFQKVDQLRRLALLAVETKQPDEARQWLEQTQEPTQDVLKAPDIIAEDKASILSGLSQVYRQLGDNKKALELLQKASALKSAPPEVIQQTKFGIAGILLEEQNFEAARDLLQGIVDSPGVDDGLYGLARYVLATSYLNEQRIDEGLSKLSAVANDKRVPLTTRAQVQRMRGKTFKQQQKWPEAQVAYQSALAFYEEAAKTDADARGQEGPVYKSYIEAYEKQHGKGEAQDEAMRLFAPLSNKAEAFRGAFDYRAALPYYEAMQGLVDYIPFEFYLTTKVGLGEMLMYGKQWDEARTLINTAAGLTMSAGVAGQQRQNIAILQQNAQRLLAYSYVLQGQTQGGAIEYARARELYDALLATPDLNAAIRAMADKNIKELDAPQT